MGEGESDQEALIDLENQDFSFLEVEEARVVHEKGRAKWDGQLVIRMFGYEVRL